MRHPRILTGFKNNFFSLNKLLTTVVAASLVINASLGLFSVRAKASSDDTMLAAYETKDAGYPSVGSDFYGYIMNIHTGNYVTLNSNGNVTSNSFTGNKNQIWHFQRDSSVSSILAISSMDDKYFMGIDNISSVTSGSNISCGAWNTSWIIDGTATECSILSYQNNNFALDVTDASSVSGTNIQAYKDIDSTGQKFQIKYLSSPDRGYFDSYYCDYIPSSTLTYGSTGDGVIWAQRCLNTLGYSVEVDGSFGPNFRDALKRFQSDQGLSVDGNLGPITRQRIIDLIAITDYSLTIDSTTVKEGFITVKAEAAYDKPVCNYNFHVINPDGTDYGEYRRGKDNTFTFYPRQGAGQYKVYCNINNDCSSYMALMVYNKYYTITVLNDMGDATISAIPNQTYTGSAITPAITVKDGSTTLTNGTHYSVSYSNNTNVGTATVTVTGKGTYTGTKTATFKINAKSASGFTVSSIAAQTYTGSAITPAITVKDGTKTLTNGTHYSVAYSNNINAGTATVTITGKGNYTGTKTATFKINAKSASGFTVSSIAAQTYTGSAITPAVTVKDGTKTLTNGTHYSVAYSNNTNAGTATVTITGKGNYTGTKTATFKINAKSASGFTVSTIAAQTYTGSAITPAITVKDGTKTLTNGTHYSVAYTNNTNVGTATVTITGKGNYTGTKTVTFKINAKSVSGFTVSSIEDQTYTGSAITPAITVKDGTKTLTNGTHYSVAYSNNINVGTATITITGKGNYTGIKTVTFRIVVEADSIPQNLTASAGDGNVILTWDAVNYASKYSVQRNSGSGWITAVTTEAVTYTDTGLSNGTSYMYRVCAHIGGAAGDFSVVVTAVPFDTTPSDIKAVSGNNKTVISWTAVSGAIKYRLQRTTGSSW